MPVSSCGTVTKRSKTSLQNWEARLLQKRETGVFLGYSQSNSNWSGWLRESSSTWHPWHCLWLASAACEYIWPMYDGYRKAPEYISNVIVVNEIAEWGVKMTGSANIISTDSQPSQYLLLIVEYDHIQFDNFMKQTLDKWKLNVLITWAIEFSVIWKEC